MPLLVNMQPAGTYLGEDYYRAGGLPAVLNELLRANRLHADALTINGRTVGANASSAIVCDPDVIRPYAKPLKEKAGFKVLSGNLFKSAIMKISVISQEFSDRYLSNPDDPNAFEGTAVVFDGPEDYHQRIDDPSLKIDERTILVMRGTGPIGYPGSGEVVNMRPPAALISKGITSLPCVGDAVGIGVAVDASTRRRSSRASAFIAFAAGDRVRVGRWRQSRCCCSARTLPNNRTPLKRLCVSKQTPSRHGQPEFSNCPPGWSCELP